MQPTGSTMLEQSHYINLLNVSLFSVLVTLLTLIVFRVLIFLRTTSTSTVAADKLSEWTSKLKNNLLKDISVVDVRWELLPVPHNVFDDRVQV